MKIRVNEKSLSAKIDKAMEAKAEQTKERLKEVAFDLTTRTPVDTGAFARSFSVVFPASGGGGRKVSSANKPGGQDLEEYRSLAYQNMSSDIESIDLRANYSASFRNRADHASVVENKYQVFGAVKDINR